MMTVMLRMIMIIMMMMTMMLMLVVMFSIRFKCNWRRSHHAQLQCTPLHARALLRLYAGFIIALTAASLEANAGGERPHRPWAPLGRPSQ